MVDNGCPRKNSVKAGRRPAAQDCVCHDKRRIALNKIAVQLLSDVCRFAVLLFRPSGALIAENLFLRR
jgi:hypothetical protein